MPDSSMSFTCQALPTDTTVTVYRPVMDFAGCVELTCWLIVTRKVIDVGLLPNELIESIVPRPVYTCLSAVRGPATPDVP
jgi:hypothetical protein